MLKQDRLCPSWQSVIVRLFNRQIRGNASFFHVNLQGFSSRVLSSGKKLSVRIIKKKKKTHPTTFKQNSGVYIQVYAHLWIQFQCLQLGKWNDPLEKYLMKLVIMSGVKCTCFCTGNWCLSSMLYVYLLKDTMHLYYCTDFILGWFPLWHTSDSLSLVIHLYYWLTPTGPIY